MVHRRVGGVTTSQVLVGFKGFTPSPAPLAAFRTLGHIIDPASCPMPCHCNPPFPHYDRNALLRVQDIQTPAVFRSDWSATGWGVRQFTSREICHALDFPLWLQVATPAVNALLSSSLLPAVLPCKMMLHCIDRWLGSLPPLLPSSLLEPPVPASSLLPSSTTFDGVGTLSHDWADLQLVSDRAVKADGASVPSSMWDHRLTLLFPCSLHHLDAIRNFLLRLWRR